MKNIFTLLAIIGITLALGGCGGAAVQPEVEDRAGAETKGVDAGGLADLRSERRIHFALDSSAVDEENAAIVEAHAKYLVANPGITITLEGHCDERGTREYNLALGERRANAVARMMQVLGVGSARITTISYGEEKPLELEHNESAWRLNRRVEIIY